MWPQILNPDPGPIPHDRREKEILMAGRQGRGEEGESPGSLGLALTHPPPQSRQRDRNESKQPKMRVWKTVTKTKPEPLGALAPAPQPCHLRVCTGFRMGGGRSSRVSPSTFSGPACLTDSWDLNKSDVSIPSGFWKWDRRHWQPLLQLDRIALGWRPGSQLLK